MVTAEQFDALNYVLLLPDGLLFGAEMGTAEPLDAFTYFLPEGADGPGAHFPHHQAQMDHDRRYHSEESELPYEDSEYESPEDVEYD